MFMTFFFLLFFFLLRFFFPCPHHPSQRRRRKKKRKKKRRKKKKRRRNKLFSAATEVSAPTEGRDRSNVSSPTLFVSHQSCCSKLSPPVASCCSGFFAPSIF